MYEEIIDYRAQNYLRNLIDNLPYQNRVRLKTLRNCNTMPAGVGERRVYLLRSDKGRTSFFGLQTCKNSWICPHCAAKQMKKYRERIAAAIDLQKEEGNEAIMITFGNPHVKTQSCQEVTQVLYDTFNECFKEVFNNHKRRNGAFRSSSPFNAFFHKCEIKHYVRAAEYTFGANGWHPHFHCLFWLPKSKVQSALQWEEKLNDFWNKKFKKCVTKYWKKYGTKTPEKLRNYLFNTKNKQLGLSQSVYISKNQKGTVMTANSAWYLTGFKKWSAEDELTGLEYKTADKVHLGQHYTPYELLELAMNGNKKAEKIYTEYLLTVTQKPVHQRIRFSRTGICAAAKLYLQQQKCSAVIKKKHEESKENWVVFAWFTNEEWFNISCDNYATENIAALCALDRKDLLQDYLWQVFKIPLHDNLSPIAKMIQNQIYNKQIA